MKFLVFNMAVVAALAYLVLAHQPAVSPLLDQARETALQVRDDVVAAAAAKKTAATTQEEKPASDGLEDSALLARLAVIEESLGTLQDRLDEALVHRAAQTGAQSENEDVVAISSPDSKPFVTPAEILAQDEPVLDVENVATAIPQSLLPTSEVAPSPAMSVRDREVALGALAEDMEMLYARKMGE